MPLNIIIPVFSWLVLISSCENRSVSPLLSVNELEKLRLEFNLPKDRTFKLDSSYLPYLFSFDTIMFANEIKNHYQPVQASYYDRSGKLISFHINCYAGPAAEGEELSWNQMNAFDSFVPRSVAPTDDILSFNKHLSFLKTFDNQPIDTTGYSEFDYTVIIHWSKKMHSLGSRKLIRIVNDNSRLAGAGTINIIYVNNDDLW